MSNQIDHLAQIVWGYHHLHHELKKADCILVLGSNDIRVAEFAANLYLQGYAPLLACSGGFGVLTQGLYKKPEAEVFADIAIQRGVPKDNIIVENAASNTGENITFTRKLLSERGLDPTSFLLVQKPYMERRTFATFKKVWPEKEFIVTSPPLSFEEYPTPDLPKDLIINIMVGDLQRIKLYAEKGFQIHQEIPDNVWQAFEQLVILGYTKHLIDEHA